MNKSSKDTSFVEMLYALTRAGITIEFSHGSEGEITVHWGSDREVSPWEHAHLGDLSDINMKELECSVRRHLGKLLEKYAK